MTDYDPRVARPISTDESVRADTVLEPRSPSRGLYLALGAVAALAIAVGLMFMSGPASDRGDTARAPDPAQINTPADTTRTPSLPMRPAPAPAPERAPAQE